MSTCENRTQKAPRTAKLAVGDESLSVPCGNTPKEKFSNINMEAFLFRSATKHLRTAILSRTSYVYTDFANSFANRDRQAPTPPPLLLRLQNLKSIHHPTKKQKQPRAAWSSAAYHKITCVYSVSPPRFGSVTQWYSCSYCCARNLC